MTVAAGYETIPKCWNEQGFQVACGGTSAPAALTTAAAATNHQPSEVLGAIAATTTTSSSQKNSARGTSLAIPIWCAVGFVAIAVFL